MSSVCVLSASEQCTWFKGDGEVVDEGEREREREREREGGKREGREWGWERRERVGITLLIDRSSSKSAHHRKHVVGGCVVCGRGYRVKKKITQRGCMVYISDS